MKYEIVDEPGGPRLVLRDQLTLADRDTFETATDKLLARRKPMVTVDLAGVTYMDSAGLGMLLTLRDRAERAQTEVRLSRASGEVRELLTLACFDSLFATADA
jgi:anti-sigma B factor antagonist